jgi:copper(I)-binding protein
LILLSQNHSKNIKRRNSITALTALVMSFSLYTVAGADIVNVANVWSRPAISTGVVYATLHDTTNVADQLDEVSTTVARTASLHRSENKKMPAQSSNVMDSMMASGVMTMHGVKAIQVPAHGSTMLQPGSFHIMLDGLYHPLHLGQHFAVRMHFLHAGWITTTAVVQ